MWAQAWVHGSFRKERRRQSLRDVVTVSDEGHPPIVAENLARVRSQSVVQEDVYDGLRFVLAASETGLWEHTQNFEDVYQ
jgi:hypothetical protein